MSVNPKQLNQRDVYDLLNLFGFVAVLVAGLIYGVIGIFYADLRGFMGILMGITILAVVVVIGGIQYLFWNSKSQEDK